MSEKMSVGDYSMQGTPGEPPYTSQKKELWRSRQMLQNVYNRASASSVMLLAY
jgi:hypothetical protein